MEMGLVAFRNCLEVALSPAKLPELASCLAGISNLAHFRFKENLSAFEKICLDEETLKSLKDLKSLPRLFSFRWKKFQKGVNALSTLILFVDHMAGRSILELKVPLFLQRACAWNELRRDIKLLVKRFSSSKSGLRSDLKKINAVLLCISSCVFVKILPSLDKRLMLCLEISSFAIGVFLSAQNKEKEKAKKDKKSK